MKAPRRHHPEAFDNVKSSRRYQKFSLSRRAWLNGVEDGSRLKRIGTNADRVTALSPMMVPSVPPHLAGKGNRAPATSRITGGFWGSGASLFPNKSSQPCANSWDSLMSRYCNARVLPSNDEAGKKKHCLGVRVYVDLPGTIVVAG